MKAADAARRTCAKCRSHLRWIAPAWDCDCDGDDHDDDVNGLNGLYSVDLRRDLAHLDCGCVFDDFLLSFYAHQVLDDDAGSCLLWTWKVLPYPQFWTQFPWASHLGNVWLLMKKKLWEELQNPVWPFLL